MASHRINIQMPKLNVEVEVFARHLAGALMPGMEASFGPIEARQPDGPVRVTSWSAHTWQEDGTFVVLSVEPVSNQLTLYLDTKGLEQPGAEPSPWVGRALVLIVIAGLAFGIWQRSVLLGFGLPVVLVASWVGIDILRQIAKERRRRIDVSWWESHLAECQRAASGGDHRAQ
jgi:hypothetical protein